jgi:hypothetical protein
MIINGTPWFDLYKYDPFPSELTEFETINPIRIEYDSEGKIHRGDEFVTQYRNFVFEMDDKDLNQQKIIAKRLFQKGLINRVVFSGKKSLHLRVSVKEESEPKSKEEYEFLRNIIKTDILKLKSDDPAVKDPSRLTRYPNGTRYARDEHGLYVFTIPGQHKIEAKQTLLYSNNEELTIVWGSKWEADKYRRWCVEEDLKKKSKSYTGSFNLEKFVENTKNENVRKLFNNNFAEGERNTGCMSAIGTLKKAGCPNELIENLIKRVSLGSEMERKNFLRRI